MNWDEKAKEATRGRVYQFRGESWAFIEGSHWMRDQLRTDEAVERVSDALCVEEEGMTLAEHEANCELPICGFRQSFLADARRNITALLGEEP